MIVRPVRRGLRRLLMATARLLPPARGEALVVVTKGAFTLITGRRTSAVPKARKPKAPVEKRPPKRPEVAKAGASAADALPKYARDELDRAERAMQEGRRTEVIQRTDRLERQLPTNRRVLELRAEALAGAGDAAAHAIALHRLHVLRDDAAVRRQERLAVGEVVATSPEWLPRVPGPGEALAPRADAAVLCLVAESAPYRITVETERQRANAASVLAAGLRPEIVTALGFPRSIGVAAFPALDDAGGIPCHRLDLGPHYTLDRAPDRLLRDAAWLLAGVVRRVAPAVLHVVTDARDPGPALLGLAIRQHFELPVVLEVAGAGPRAGDADGARRDAAWTRVFELVDRVVTSQEQARDELLARGIDASRITLVADAAEDPGYGERMRAVYEATISPATSRAR